MRDHSDSMAEANRGADRLLRRLAEQPDATASPEYRDLLNLIRDLNPGFAFDREGRPGAIDAVRQALPAIERDLFDAIVEDYTCELAASEEAVYALARAFARHTRRD